MQKSTYISAGGHALLLGYAFFGGLFNAEPLELPEMDISVISEAEFAALRQAAQPPDVEPIAPDPILSAPEPETDPEPVVPVLEPTPEPRPEPPQIVEPELAPLPPEPAPEPEPLPEPVEEAVVIPGVAPDTSLRPKPRPADRVASEAVAAPEPDVEIDNSAQEASEPDANAEQVVEEQSETAPEEAATEIVTEAEQLSASAQSAATRPRARPRDTAAASEAKQSDTSSGVNAALAEALGEPAASDEVSGSTLTAGEVNGFKVAVQDCWAVDIGSQSSDVVVVVTMSLDQSGKVVPGSIELKSSSGGAGRAVETAFLRARRAIFGCQNDGYDLPDDKYEQWKDIEVTFNPKEFRTR